MDNDRDDGHRKWFGASFSFRVFRDDGPNAFNVLALIVASLLGGGVFFAVLRAFQWWD